MTGMVSQQRGVEQVTFGTTVTSREAQVLDAVLERLHNREIAAHLGVSVRTVESHVSSLLRKFGVADRSGLLALADTWRSREDDAAGAIPALLTPLVARDDEMREVLALLERSRLVTLSGPGGVGKSRLAVEIAHTIRAEAQADVRVADLATLRSEEVVPTVAASFGVGDHLGPSLSDAVRDRVRQRPTFLIVDNCEHVVTAVAPLVEALLGAARELVILATSREVLGIAGEVTYGLLPLPVPLATDRVDPSSAPSFGAVQLFTTRASQARPDFELDATNIDAVTEICRRLDGLPLALELAAARIRTFTPPELLAHLNDRFALLTGGPRTALERHRTLEATISWSYDLLDDEEQRLVERIALFANPFDYAAIEAVCAAPPLDRAIVMGRFPDLLAKSWIVVRPSASQGSRYELLESMRAFLATRLEQRGDVAALRDDHLGHYLSFAEAAALELRGPLFSEWHPRLVTELPNLRLAMAHAAQLPDPEAGARFVSALAEFWHGYGRREARMWIERLLGRGELPASGPVVTALADAAMLAVAWDIDETRRNAELAAQLADSLDEHHRAIAWLAVGWADTYQRKGAPHQHLDRARDVFVSEGDLRRAAEVDMALGLAAGDSAEALTYTQRALDGFRRGGHPGMVANALYMLGTTTLDLHGPTEQVWAWIKESLELSERANTEHDRAHARLTLGRLYVAVGDDRKATEFLERALHELEVVGDVRCSGRALGLLGQVANRNDDRVGARDLLRRAVATSAAAGDGPALVRVLNDLAIGSAAEEPNLAATLLGAAEHQLSQLPAGDLSVPPEIEQLKRSLKVELGSGAFDIAYEKGLTEDPRNLVNA